MEELMSKVRSIRVSDKYMAKFRKLAKEKKWTHQDFFEYLIDQEIMRKKAVTNG